MVRKQIRRTTITTLTGLAGLALLLAPAALAQEATPAPDAPIEQETEDEDFDPSELDPVIEHPIAYDLAAWSDEYEVEPEDAASATGTAPNAEEVASAAPPAPPGPPVAETATGSTSYEPRGLLRRKKKTDAAEAGNGAIPPGTQADLDTEFQKLHDPTPRPPGQPQNQPRPWVSWKSRIRSVVPQPNGLIQTNRSSYRVKKGLGAGATGGAYLIEDVSNRATRGQVAVLKHTQPADPPDVNDVPNDPYHEMNAARRARGNRNLTPEELVDAETSHEVEMQNLMAGRERGFMPASKLTGNRIKMPYAGPTVGAIADELKADLKAGRISDKEYRAVVQQLTRQTLQATAALGRQGVVHRDLKTDNLSIDSNGEMRVLDFGLAKRAQQRDWDLMVDRGVGYRSMGNPLYQAPEANEGRRGENTMSTHKSDVFYAGKALRSKITDQWVHDGVENQREMLDPQVNALSKRATKGKRIDRLFDAMTADDPEKRPTAQQALDDKRYWEKFDRRTQNAASQRIRDISARLAQQQLAAAPAAGGPPGPGGNP